MAEALDSPRRKAEFERMNREDVRQSASRLSAMNVEERLEAGLRLNSVAFEFARALAAGRASGRA